jgi:mRNA-degrading endonuclease RelE of RelBE toxin-antitoxin system
VSASEIIKELPKLSEAERRAVLEKLHELTEREKSTSHRAVDLRSRGTSENQASDLRARLKTFAEDWERPEAAIYDEDAAG